MEIYLIVFSYFFLVLDIAVFLCSVIGNSVVIYVISREKALKSKLNLLILSVATSDFMIGLIGIPLGLRAVRKFYENWW